MVDKPTWFEIDTTGLFRNFYLLVFAIIVDDVYSTDAGNGLAEVVITDARGRSDAVPVSLKQTTPGKYRCEYVPREPGPHSVNVLFAGRPVPNSPFAVNVLPCK